VEPIPAPEMLAKYGLAPSRRMGQNFLIDRNVARKMVEASAVGPGDVVVEVGPGFGAITFGLAERAARVLGVERDSGIVRAFREEYGDVPRVELVESDFLEFDLGRAARRAGASKVVVVGNLPYNATSPVLRRLVEEKHVIERAVLMVQLEVAARMAAPPGDPDYSSLSAVLAFHAAVRPMFVVRRTCFYPRPAVDSRLVELDFNAAPELGVDAGAYAAVVHAAFAKRRKMLRRSLAEVAADAGLSIADLAEASGIDLARRGETLSVAEFAALAGVLARGRKAPGVTEEA